MLDGPLKVLNISLSIAAGLLVLFIIGVLNHPHARGMTAVAEGIVAIFSGIGTLLSNL